MKIKMINQNKSDCMNATKLGASLSILFVSLMIFASMLFSIQVVSAIDPNPTAPELGESGRFVVLASQTITTTPGSSISNGDLGVMDQARTYAAAGFTPSGSEGALVELTNGMSYASDDVNPLPFPYPLKYATIVIGAPWATTLAMINQVRTDEGIATSFLEATNPTAPDIVCPTELGTLTLTRGVYKTAVDVGITTGPLTLDAEGDSDSVFIFVIGGKLTIGAPSGGIILKNGAQAKNIYFRTQGLTKIEAGMIVKGNIFAKTQINVDAGADIEGRLFASTDQVTLISNVVTMPTDTTLPAISYSNGTEVNDSSKDQDYIYVNVSITEANFKNVTFNLYNSSNELINTTDFTDDNRSVNFTLIPYGVYYYNVTAYDTAGNQNSTDTYKITLGAVVEPVVTSSNSGGGGGGCTTRYTCTEWSACSTTGTQTRTCSYPANWCKPSVDKPTEFQSCTITATTTPETETIELTDNPTNTAPIKTTPGITGGVIGTGTTAGKVGLIVLIGLVIAGIAGAAVFLIRKYN